MSRYSEFERISKNYTFCRMNAQVEAALRWRLSWSLGRKTIKNIIP